MERKRIADKDIEDYLSQLEDGSLSDDGNEVDENDFEEILTTAELRAVIEDGEQFEPQADVQDPPLIEDSPLIEDPVPGIHNYTSSGSQPIHEAIDVQRLIWKKQSLISQEDNIRFQGCNDLPASIMTLETPFQFFSYYFTPDFEMSSVSWKDNRQVTLLSTYVGAEPVSTIERYDKVEKRKKFIQCPKVVKEYNAHMGGVDLMDSYLGRYRIRMKSRKWYIRLFHHLLDLTVINSWVLYKQVCYKKKIAAKDILNLAEFRTELADVLCKYKIHTQPARGRPSSNGTIEEPAPKRRNTLQVVPSTDIIHDGIDHKQIRMDNRMRCMMPGCKLLAKQHQM